MAETPLPYSEKVMDHFRNPRNVGVMENPSGVGKVGNPVCGDVMELFIKVENNTEFERQGLDLFINKTISLKEALCGFSFELKYINGKTYTLNNTLGNIIPPNYKKVIMNMGLTREGRVGNLIIHFIVEFPEKMEVSQLEALNNIL